MTLQKIYYASPIGNLSLVADDQGLIGVWFLGQEHFERGLDTTVRIGTSPCLERTVDWLERYFAGDQPRVNELSLTPRGTVFQQRVWTELLHIPYGQTTTYKRLAQQLGCASAQAIGGAVGKNPIAVIIPCHRVLGSDGRLTGYAGGLERKHWLLSHESDCTNDGHP